MKFIDQIPQLCSKEEDSCGGASNGDVTFFIKPDLVLSFDFWFSRFRTFTYRNTFFPHTLLEVCPSHKDKVEIKCMGSVGGKTPTEPKFYGKIGFIAPKERESKKYHRKFIAP